ncbi:MAG: sugar nucleotide-binding protein [Verrucomicrobiales bacterium]|nr:sugar nucleotide-binding protein [Verrucomicrobiales bacterium]
MPERIVIIGANGRLGRAILGFCEGRFEVLPLISADLNLTWPEELIRTVLEPEDFDLLLTTAAFNDVDKCEGNPVADQINGAAPGILAKICAEKNARMIHFSTNYVFDGSKAEPYTEDDPVCPISDYGRSKLLGEQEVLGVSEDNLVIRLSWLFGPGDEKNEATPDWAIRQAVKSDAVCIVEDCWASPGYTLDVAEAVIGLFEKPDVKGILHLANEGTCSWKEFGQHSINCADELGIPVKSKTVGGTTLESIFGHSGRAPRPVHGSLSNARYEALTGNRLRNWEDAVRHYVKHTVAARYLDS